jgi:pre-mRNA cleavage complex 2 protein Pcf11
MEAIRYAHIIYPLLVYTNTLLKPLGQTYANPVSAPNYQQPDGFGQSTGSIDSLHNDIANLIATTRTEFATNPFDEGIRARLKALLDLQSILQSQQLPPDQLRLIKDQVAQLTPQPIITAPISTPIPPQPQQQQQQPPLQTMFPPSALAALLASTATTQQPTTPSLQLALPVSQSLNPYTQASSASTQGITSGENSLLASLRAAGMLPAPSGNPAPPPLPPPPLPATQLPPSLPFQIPFPLPHVSTPPSIHASLTQPSQGRVLNDVQMTPASLKM